MFYYSKANDLYSSTVPIVSPDFTEITVAEYKERLTKAQQSRQQGEPATNIEEW